MRASKNIAFDIHAVEGFAVMFTSPGGTDVSSRRVEEYPYSRAARGAWSVAEWKQERFAASYPEFTVDVLDPDGIVVHGKTLLENLRQRFIDAVWEDEPDAEPIAASPAPVVAALGAVAVKPSSNPQKSVPLSGRAGMSLSNDELSKLWDSANLLRKNLDAAEYKHIVLGLVFLKYISDSFDSRRTELEALFADSTSDKYKADEKRRATALEERDYYKEVNVFWVPKKARWADIQANSKQPKIAEMIDEALLVIERENPKLEGILERKYSDAKLKPAELGAVVDLIGSMNFGKGRAQTSDTLGQVYEYFLGMFASAEGKLGGQFYTTPSIVRTLVEVLQPTKGRVYDPCCGSGGMFVQSERFVEAHGGNLGEIAIYGQESNPTTRRLCAMNLAIRGIDFDLGKTHADSFTQDQHADLRFDYILMNPPFGKNASYPKAELINDVRWKKYGVPRESPANYAWMSHAVHHLTPKGRAGIVMPRGTLTSSQGGDDSIRKAFLEDDVVECIIDLPGQLFFNTQIPCTLWFFNKDKSKWKNNRENQVLFIDARKLGTAISRNQIEFSDKEIRKISGTFDDWCSGNYEDIDWFCRSVTRDEISRTGNTLSPGRYIGVGDVYEELQINSEVLDGLISTLSEQLAHSNSLERDIRKTLKGLGYEI